MPVQPCAGFMMLGMLLKQWDSAHQLCIQCFKAIATLFVALNHTLLNSSSGHQKFTTRVALGTLTSAVSSISNLPIANAIRYPNRESY